MFLSTIADRQGDAAARRELLGLMDEWVAQAGVELRGAGVDESPHCYKRLPDVLAHHGDSIEILHTLTPVGVAMAGADVRDPYKD